MFFSRRSDGSVRKENAAHVAKHRAVQPIIDAIKRAGVDNEQKSTALRTALMHPDIADISDRIRVLKNIADSKAHNELVFCFE